VTSIHRWAALAFLLVVFGAGVGLGYLMFHVPPGPAETAAPEVRITDGSVLLERDPEAKPEVRKPAIMRGHEVVRTVEVKAKGHEAIKVADSPHGCPTYTCPPVRVRLDLLRGDHGYRVQASSDTEILDGVDIPVGHLGPAPYKWAAGYARIDGSDGVTVHRDIGRLRVGVGITTDGRKAAEVLWRF
jgi:hypothetical protein